VDLDVLAYNVSLQNAVKLSHGVTAEVSGNYNSPSIWQGAFKATHAWNLDAGLQKTLFKGQGSIKAVVTDIFYTQNAVVTTSFAGQTGTTRYYVETRQFKLNFTYRFGNIQLKAARARSSGADEEIKRSKSGG
jgi:iron complex outermembrane receptor protein